MTLPSHGPKIMRRALPLAGLAALLALAGPPATRADDARPFLSPLFSDNMVLQRDQKVPVWGWTTPGTPVAVRIFGKGGNFGKQARAVAGADGKWTALLPALAADGQAYTLAVTSGAHSEARANVLVGDVWICSGQSNMEFGIGNAVNAQAEVAQANYPNIRLFLNNHNVASSPQAVPRGGTWEVCTPQNVLHSAQSGWNGFSAVGYFFGRDIFRKTHVPVGLIETNWGGTLAQAWTSGDALATLPDFKPAVEAQRRSLATPGGPEAAVAAWYARHDAGSAGQGGQAWADPALNTADWPTMTLPQAWEGAGVPALANFDGVVWFRKEFTLTPAEALTPLTLHLGPIDDRDTTYVNGVKVGGLSDYAAPRDYRVPASALRAGRNVVAVRVLDTGGGGGIDGKPEQMSLEPAGAAPAPLAGAWAYKIGGALPADDPAPALPGTNPNDDDVLYNGMIAPLIPFGIKGAIWYQGEANAGAARQYQTLLPTLIGDWRARWGEGAFPFLIVQLANYDPDAVRHTQPGESAWAELREAQALTASRVPKSGLAVAVDIGDVGDIHPKNKQEVGRRLALAAETVAYGLPGESSGPVYAGMTREGGAVRLRFSHATGGLTAQGGPLGAFAVAGADGKFVWADARIDGNTVVVSSPSVPAPADVRYAWADSPAGANLYSGVGLPAVPFRTGR